MPSPALLPALLLSLLAWSAGAAEPPEVPPGVVEYVLTEPVDWTVSPQLHDALLEEASGRSPADAAGVFLWATGPDGVLRPLEDFLPPAPPPPKKTGHHRPPEVWGSTHPVDHHGTTSGFLTDRAVYLSQCHGWIWYTSLGSFSTQRPNLYSTVEDFHNPEAMNQYLARYLENAGAAVFTVKDRDMNPLMALVDDGDQGYEEEGSGFTDGAAGWGPRASWSYGQNPFTTGGTRRFPAGGGALARWTPEVPEDGWYGVHLSWDATSDNSREAHYRIIHPGGTIHRYYDQTVHGSTWIYAETLWLPAGTGGLVVELVADGPSDKWLSADAIRIGSGMGDVTRHGVTTGRPRWEEGAIMATQWNGAPTSVYDPYNEGDGSDPASRSRWASWEHPSGEDALYLSWHTNAGGGTGTSTHVYSGSSGSATEGSWQLGELLQEEMMSAIRTLWDGNWSDRGTRFDAFAEINPSHNAHMPAALVELAFHDHAGDVELIKHPEFRRDAARSMYRAIVRYFAERDGLQPGFLPEPPDSFAVLHGPDGRLRASWAPGPAGDPFGDAAVDYLIQTSPDGRSWDDGEAVSGTSHTLDAAPGETLYLRVSARNEGGVSFPSEVLGARRSPDGYAPVLVVAAFDRLDGGLLVPESVGRTVGDVVRMYLERMNTFDGAVAHGEAVAGAGWYFDSVSDEVFDTMDLSPWPLVMWVAGEESTEHESFSSHQQGMLRQFVAAGGALWATGSEILWDLDHRGSESDRAFAEEILGALMEADSSGTTAAYGEGLLEGLSLSFGEEDGAPYPVEYPDVLGSQRAPMARYAGGDLAGTLEDGVFMLGFPFECVGDPWVRVEVAARLLPALVPDYDPPEPDTGSPGDTGQPGGRYPTPRGVPPVGCGCGMTAPYPAMVAALPLFILLLRRRRARRLGASA